MLHYLLGLTLLLALLTEAKAQLTKCNGASQLIELHFDDILVTSTSYVVLQRPYKGFNFVGSDSPFPLIMNTSANTNLYFNQAASTKPNLIFTDGAALFLTYSDQSQSKKAFGVLTFTISSIFYPNMAVTIQTLRNDKIQTITNITVPLTVPTTVVVGQDNIDMLVVSCTFGDNLDLCMHMAFDSFMVCH